MTTELGEPPRRVVRSVPPRVSSFDACARLLARVEELPGDATGALTFDEGLVLVDKQRVCWAIAASMGVYFTDLLCEGEAPKVERRELEALYRRCKLNGLRLSEELLTSGLVSEARLRRALSEHSSEAIVRLSCATARPVFRRLSRSGYDARFLLTPVELLAAIGARGGESRAEEAIRELEDALMDGATGVAFTRDEAGGGPAVVAVNGRAPLAVWEALALCRWGSDALALGIIVDPRTLLVSTTRGANTSVVAWRAQRVSCAAFCTSRVASAVLVDRVAKRRRGFAAEAKGGTP